MPSSRYFFPVTHRNHPPKEVLNGLSPVCRSKKNPVKSYWKLYYVWQPQHCCMTITVQTRPFNQLTLDKHVGGSCHRRMWLLPLKGDRRVHSDSPTSHAKFLHALILSVSLMLLFGLCACWFRSLLCQESMLFLLFEFNFPCVPCDYFR